jgi:thiol-disulfide isomerase/thioredoxin
MLIDMNSSKTLRSIVFTLFVSVALISLACSSGSVVDDSLSSAAKSYKPPVNPPRPVADNVNNYDLQMLTGGSKKMSELLGNKKVVLVNFWATWCGPCRREIPDLTALKKQFDGKDVEIIGLTVEEPDKQAMVQAFAQQFSINYPLGFAQQEIFMLFNEANGGDPRFPIPQSFIFDKNGKLVDSVKGLRRDFRAWAEGAIGHALKNS